MGVALERLVLHCCGCSTSIYSPIYGGHCAPNEGRGDLVDVLPLVVPECSHSPLRGIGIRSDRALRATATTQGSTGRPLAMAAQHAAAQRQYIALRSSVKVTEDHLADIDRHDDEASAPFIVHVGLCSVVAIRSAHRKRSCAASVQWRSAVARLRLTLRSSSLCTGPKN